MIMISKQLIMPARICMQLLTKSPLTINSTDISKLEWFLPYPPQLHYPLLSSQVVFMTWREKQRNNNKKQRYLPNNSCNSSSVISGEFILPTQRDLSCSVGFELNRRSDHWHGQTCVYYTHSHNDILPIHISAMFTI